MPYRGLRALTWPDRAPADPLCDAGRPDDRSVSLPDGSLAVLDTDPNSGPGRPGKAAAAGPCPGAGHSLRVAKDPGHPLRGAGPATTASPRWAPSSTSSLRPKSFRSGAPRGRVRVESPSRSAPGAAGAVGDHERRLPAGGARRRLEPVARRHPGAPRAGSRAAWSSTTRR
ncbi:hypothetical protein ACRAWD_14440 [Caulobacter segnis]